MGPSAHPHSSKVHQLADVHPTQWLLRCDLTVLCRRCGKTNLRNRTLHPQCKPPTSHGLKMLHHLMRGQCPRGSLNVFPVLTAILFFPPPHSDLHRWGHLSYQMRVRYMLEDGLYDRHGHG